MPETALSAQSEEVRLDLTPPDVIVRTMLTLDRAADDYLGDCRRRGFSERTLNTYRRTYDEFCGRLRVDCDVSEISTDELRRFLASKSHLAPGTVAGVEAHLASLFKWLMLERKIARDPMAALPRTRRRRAEDLDVTTVSTGDVRRMLMAASGWAERLCLGILVYTGCRRAAAARLRLMDYDRSRGRLRFKEKGGKTIWKPVPDELARLLDAAIAAGVYEEPITVTEVGRGITKVRTERLTPDQAYLIPNEGPRNGVRRNERALVERDDRIIWRLVKQIADRAGVNAHTHSLRAAFACFYLETHQRDTVALKELLGHRSIATTETYLRRLDKEREMERVRDLSWGVEIGNELVAV